MECQGSTITVFEAKCYTHVAVARGDICLECGRRCRSFGYCLPWLVQSEWYAAYSAARPRPSCKASLHAARQQGYSTIHPQHNKIAIPHTNFLNFGALDLPYNPNPIDTSTNKNDKGFKRLKRNTAYDARSHIWLWKAEEALYKQSLHHRIELKERFRLGLTSFRYS